MKKISSFHELKETVVLFRLLKKAIKLMNIKNEFDSNKFNILCNITRNVDTVLKSFATFCRDNEELYYLDRGDKSENFSSPLYYGEFVRKLLDMELKDDQIIIKYIVSSSLKSEYRVWIVDNRFFGGRDKIRASRRELINNRLRVKLLKQKEEYVSQIVDLSQSISYIDIELKNLKEI